MWTEPSRDHIWSAVDKPCELFRLLSPITPCPKDISDSDSDTETDIDEDKSHRFLRLPTQAQWKKFLPFSRRVRRLWFTTCLASIVPLLEDILSTQPAGLATCFPRLSNLQMANSGTYQHLVNAILQHSITIFQIQAHVDDPRYPADAVFQDIVEKAPNIKTLFFRADQVQSVQDIEAPLCTCFSQLSKLSAVEVPLYFLTTSMANVLLNNEGIKMITLSGTLHPDHDVSNREDGRPPNEIAPFSPVLQKGLTRTLHILHLCVSFADAMTLFSGGTSSFPSLREILVRSLSVEGENSARSLFTGFERHLPHLTHLYVVATVPRQALEAEPTPEWPAEKEHEAWSFGTLSGVLKLKSLETLEIATTHRLAISDRQLEILAKNLRHLKCLSLNPIPRVQRVPILTLQSMISLAKHCPGLEELSLFVNAGAASFNHGTPAADVVPFSSNLILLRLNASPASDALRDDIVLFLSRLLPPQTQVKTTFPSFHMDTPTKLPKPATGNTWRWIEDHLRFAVKARQEERDRAAQRILS